MDFRYRLINKWDEVISPRIIDRALHRGLAFSPFMTLRFGPICSLFLALKLRNEIVELMFVRGRHWRRRS
ncbi:hypothetical protein NS226_15345 [Aureimonas ureilytica]|uniref:Uncharacterized protein n=1 Tax=Aureimonas ureilytica TaxID=401562 RepID=A0A175R5Y7_9HYPH|nr:hypothetical protein NS226_15345 [Aureimonas ureilytica]